MRAMKDRRTVSLYYTFLEGTSQRQALPLTLTLTPLLSSRFSFSASSFRFILKLSNITEFGVECC